MATSFFGGAFFGGAFFNVAVPVGGISRNPWQEEKKRQDMQHEEDEIIAIVKAIAKTMF